MRKLTAWVLMAALLGVPAVSHGEGVNQCPAANGLSGARTVGFQQFSVGTTAVGLPSVPNTALWAEINVEGNPIRYREDGAAPTAAIGTLVAPTTGTLGQIPIYIVICQQELATVKFVQATPTSVVGLTADVSAVSTSGSGATQAPVIAAVAGSQIALNELILTASAAGSATVTVAISGGPTFNLGTVSFTTGPTVISLGNYITPLGSSVTVNIGAIAAATTTVNILATRLIAPSNAILNVHYYGRG